MYVYTETLTSGCGKCDRMRVKKDTVLICVRPSILSTKKCSGVTGFHCFLCHPFIRQGAHTCQRIHIKTRVKKKKHLTDKLEIRTEQHSMEQYHKSTD